MKSCNSKIFVNSSAFLALILFCASAQFVSSAQAIVIDWVPIGNAGNAYDSYVPMQTPDLAETPNNPNNAVFGKVNYAYSISRTEVTNTQYAAFLNAVDPNGDNPQGIWDLKMQNDDGWAAVGGIDRVLGNNPGERYVVKAQRGDNPVVYVNYWDALRFTNWLHNGQGSVFQTGVYDLDGSGEVPDNAASVGRNLQNGNNVVLPNENEWYKAAFYNPTTNSYFDYATGSDNLPNSQGSPFNGPEAANYWDYLTDAYAVTGGSFPPNSTLNYLTDVGAYFNSASAYGTFDQNGNVFEWAEAVDDFITPGWQATWGSSWDGAYNEYLSAHWRNGASPNDNSFQLGFRVASVFQQSVGPGGGGVPEPSTLMLAAVGLLALARRQRRK